MPRAPILLTIFAALLATACGYTPPPQANTLSPKYQADVDACGNSVPGEVNKRNAKSGLRWFASPVTRWSEIGDGISACMEGKGWGHVRACTPEELHQGSKNPNMIVTAAGVSCIDPAAATGGKAPG